MNFQSKDIFFRVERMRVRETSFRPLDLSFSRLTLRSDVALFLEDLRRKVFLLVGLEAHFNIKRVTILLDLENRDNFFLRWIFLSFVFTLVFFVASMQLFVLNFWFCRRE